MVKERRVLKKGRIVVTRKGSFVLKLADKIYKELKLYCKKIEIGGSIRRKNKNPVDIDIILIPRNEKSKEKIEELLRKKGKFILGGEKRAAFKIQGVKVELYFTNSKEFGAALLAYSSETGASIGLRMVAKRQGFKLNQHGLFKKGKFVAGRTEREIYNALGRKWKPPEKR